MRRLPPLLALVVLVAGALVAPRFLSSRSAVVTDFAHFESGHVHPACLTPSRNRLLVVNTADGRLAVFDLGGSVPTRIAEIPVGLEPISVAALDDSTAWVVNHVSDDVSIVNLNTLHVRQTLQVGDEPADVVFAGAPTRAYVSVSQEDAVKVYDPVTLAAVHAPIAIRGRMPRALARNADGSRIYVSVFNAGNRTSVLSAAEAQDSLPPANPPPGSGLQPIPAVGLIVQQQAGNWRDESGKLWNSKVKYSLAETDVAEINTTTDSVSRAFGDIATVNFGLAVNPVDGTVAATGTEARNLIRFEPNQRGHMVDTRVGLIAPGGAVTLGDLNPLANYSVSPGTQTERDSAIGIPNAAAWSADGQRLYVTSLTSDRLGVLDPSASPMVISRRPTVAGPSGVVVDAPRNRLYVVGRFRNQLQTLSISSLSSVAIAAIGFDPTPDAIVNGRKFFYGGFTSGHGDQACATCHVFGDFDNVAWDLGDPLGTIQPKPPGQLDPLLQGFHPMKGPMVTQTLRGLPGTVLLHWRGDRANLDAFNPAFASLLGRSTQLPDSEMAAFDDFVLPLVNPPNPGEYLNRTLPTAPSGQPSAQRGQTFFFFTGVDGGQTCNFCHTANNFMPGTNGQVVDHLALQESQDMKIPQLRNLYRKTGFRDSIGVVNKRGFGFTHDGAIDNLFAFLHFPGFNFGSPQATADANRRDVEAFLLCFDTGMPPAAGYQITFFGSNDSDPTAIARLDTLKGQAEGSTNYVDLIARGRVSGQPRGWLYQGGDRWKSDKQAEGTISSATLRALGGSGSEVTVTGVPKGAGQRMGLDRDRDTYLDGDELDAHSDPGNPLSTPGNVGVTGPGADHFTLRAVRPNPSRGAVEVLFSLGRRSRVDLVVYDLMGREVRAVARGLWLEPGEQSLRWDGRRGDGRVASPGVYFLRLASPGGTWTRPVVRLE